VNGELSTLSNIVRVEQNGEIAVFNFSVEGNHNYFVLAKEYDYGQTCVLVHNANEILYRMGTSKESLNRLANKSAEALAHPKYGIHGVSVSAKQHPTIPSSSAPRSEVEKVFPVHNTTANDPMHRTVELPNPVTPEAVKLFNSLFGR